MDYPRDLPSAAELLERSTWTRQLARALVRDAATADDLIQDSWLALFFRRREDGAAASARSPRAFVGAVLANFARERFRRDAARERREARVARSEALPSTDLLLEHVELQRLVADAVARLEEPYRRTVLLCHFEGLSAAEIARREGVPAVTVRVRHKRALDRLRASLDAQFRGDRATWMRALLPLAARRPPLALGLGGLIAMKKIAIAAALLLALVVGYTVVAPVGEVAAPAIGGDVAPPEGAEASGADSSKPAQDDAPPAREVARAAGDGARAGGARLRGRVAAPRGTPPDDELFAVALESPARYAELVELEDRAPAEAPILARARVDADGRFELELPRGGPAGDGDGVGPDVHLMLRGRYLYTRESLAVAVGPEAPEVVLSPECGAWIRGSARDPDGGPAPFVRVTLEAEPRRLEIPATGVGANVRSTTQTDEDGRFEFRAVPLDDAYTLFAQPTMLAPLLERIEGLAACAPADWTLSLSAGGSARGRVVDSAGLGVAGAAVGAFLPGYFGFDDRVLRSATCDADGVFVLEALPLGELGVIASHDGYLESEKTTLAIQGGSASTELELVLPIGLALAGRVAFDDGSPAAGVRVSARFDSGFGVGPAAFGALRGAEGWAPSEADGAFRITGLGAGPFRVRASTAVDGLAFLAAQDSVRGGASELALVLHPPLSLSGTALDARGRPVPGARVHAARFARGAVALVVTDALDAKVDPADGRFRLDGFLPGRWRIVARAPGRAPSETLELELPGSAGPVALVLDAPAAVSGVVVAPDGTTVSGAVVSLAGERAPEWLQDAGPQGSAPSSTADALGRFHLGELRAGEIALQAEAPGFAQSEPVALRLVSGETAGSVRLELRRGATLTGEVYDREGAPAAGLAVNLVRWGTGDFELLGTGTDAEGRFAFQHVEPGPWQVVAIERDADLSSGESGEGTNRMLEHMRAAQIALTDGEIAHVVLGRGARTPVRVSGRVLRGGEPFPDVVLSFERADASSAEASFAVIADDGAYQVTVDGGGAYAVLLARLGEGAGQLCTVRLRVDVPEAPEHHVDLALPGGGIAGRVVGPDGAPAAGARVTVHAGAGSSAAQHLAQVFAEVATDTAGRYQVDGLVAGHYRVAAGGMPLTSHSFGAGASAGAPARVVRDGVQIGPDQWLADVDFRLPEPGTVEVFVADGAGRPAAGATVFARDAGGALVDLLSLATTDATGRVRYGGLAPGAYTFCAVAGVDVSAESAPVHVDAGDAPTLRLELAPGAILWVRVRDGGLAVVESAVSVTDELGCEVGARIPAASAVELEAAGAFGPERYRFGPLAPGRYRVVAESADGRRDERLATLEPGERTLTLRLDD